MSESPSSQRIVGYDLARAIAIFGMVVHHFVIAMAADAEHPLWLARFMRCFDGRPAALFLILAGVGITLRSRHAGDAGNSALISRERRLLSRRGIALLVLGYLNLLVWPGDILRVYGVSLVLAARLINVSNRRLICVASLFLLGFGVLLATFDYEQNWDWSTMKYHGLWTLSGSVRNLFYDGFRTVFPWSGFLFFGMWLGRLNLRNRSTNTRCLAIGITVMLIAEAISAISVWQFLLDPSIEQTRREEIQALYGTGSMPPFPLFLAAAGGMAVAVIAVSIRVADGWPQSWPVKSMVFTGQTALTWYFAHIYFGLGTIVMFEASGNQPLEVAVVCGVAFFLFACCLSWLWKQRFQNGPLEWAMRRLVG